jgi:hypothetical protein
MMGVLLTCPSASLGPGSAPGAIPCDEDEKAPRCGQVDQSSVIVIETEGNDTAIFSSPNALTQAGQI